MQARRRNTGRPWVSCVWVRSADRDGAISAFRSAMDCQPKQERAIAALRTLVVGSEPAVEALDILEPLAEEQANFAELVPLLEARPEHRG